MEATPWPARGAGGAPEQVLRNFVQRGRESVHLFATLGDRSGAPVQGGGWTPRDGGAGVRGGPRQANHASRRQLRTSGFVFVPASPAIDTRSQKTQARSRAKAEMADGNADPHRPRGGGGESQWGRQSSTAKDTSCLPKMTTPTPR